MNIVKSLSVAAILALVASPNVAADCTINLAVVSVGQGEEVPAASADYLATRLTEVVTASGISADPGMGQFFITGKFTHIVQDVVPGPPTQMAIHTYLTLYVGDLNSQTVYATTSLDLRGVGTSEQRAFINAMRGLTAGNDKVARFIASARQKIVDYYDSNFSQILARAERCSALHHYDEALWHLTSIPECCRGYDQALSATKRAFKSYVDLEGTRLLNAARAAWAASPDEFGAVKAFESLNLIDPSSEAYAEAQQLAAEIKRTVKSDRDFELRDKYRDAVDIEKAKVNAAREVGVAFGRGQQPSTTNITWLH